MILAVYTASPRKGDPARQMGRPEYSYRYVLREYMPMLEDLGQVMELERPEDADRLYREAQEHNEPFVFLCFMPPHKTPIELDCPTIPVFAWEYWALPNEAFDGKPRNDWTRMLARLGMGITHSDFTVDSVQAALDADFPIASIPAPLWERVQQIEPSVELPVTLDIDGMVIDSRETEVTSYRWSRQQQIKPDILPLPAEAERRKQQVTLDGVIYTTILNPQDGRKNWAEMITGFCQAFRYKRDATLFLKMTHYDPTDLIPEMLETLNKMSPFQCRVLLVDAHLPGNDYEYLLRASSFAVNASNGEGQALPVMEYMSAGKPAVTPAHTAMKSYVNDECAFIVDSSLEAGTWPQDRRQALRALRYRVHFQSLVRAFQCSYHVATREPETYAAMSAAARASLRAYCSRAVLTEKLDHFIRHALKIRDEATQPASGKTAETGNTRDAHGNTLA